MTFQETGELRNEKQAMRPETSEGIGLGRGMLPWIMEADAMDIFIARQAILNKAKKVFAYEILFRTGMKNAMDTSVDGYTATTNVMVSSMLDFGLKALTGGKKAFINFTEKNLTDGSIFLLPPEVIYVEILETVEATDEVIAACRKLKARGYKLVLDDFEFHPGYEPLIELADIIKVDFRITDTAEERKKMRKIIPAHVKLLAEKVETQEEFDQAVEFGYVLFQGWFFCKPAVLHKKALSTSVMAQLMLLRELNRQDFDFHHIRKIVESDPQLVQKLLIYINSPGIGIGAEITNLHQALVLLGVEGIRRWIGLIALRAIAADKPAELLTLSLIRAKFCEHIAEAVKSPEASKDAAFLVGMFSLLDAIADADMETVLAEMHLAAELQDALLGKKNALGGILDLVKAYEAGDLFEVMHWCEHFGMKASDLVACYRDAVAWAAQVSMMS